MKSPIETLPLPELYYAHLSQDYWMVDAKGKWIKITETSAKRFLNDEGYSGIEADKVLLKVQKECNVSFVGKLAGYLAGFYEMNGNQILVTESPKWIEPKEGEWPLIKHVLEGMFTPEQLVYQYGWLKCSLLSFRAGKWSQGQVLAFAGDTNSGKSIWQSLITEMFGGRSARPFLFMSGKTHFNADLPGAEHLVIEDECESKDIRTRQQFAAHIKQHAANRDQHCHGKGKDGLLLRPIQRTTISLNDEPERMLVLPPMTRDVADKLMLFKVNKQPMPMPTDTVEEKESFWNALVAELPAFIYAMLKFEIPVALKCPRFGITHFHHPDILQALEESAPQTQLLNLIDQQFFLYGGELVKEIEMTALAIVETLTDNSSRVCHTAKALLSYPNTCGTYLARLAKEPGSRVSARVVNGQTLWKIKYPKEGGEPTKG